ncbi:MAG: ABC transporter ATP-binding protein [Thermoanaerobaculia bacterium]
MSALAICAEGLGKEYELGRASAKYSTMRDLLMRGLTAPARFLRTMGHRRAAPKRIWALRDVSFDVKAGEVVGVIGRNGAGKSTLLKILSRITPPSTGRVELHGRVGSLLEVGTGFHNELTGRENIFLNGAILGMSRGAIEKHFDDIVVFAEVEPFIDTPVKHYSTGMYLRLAFAVAAHMDTEILIVDEVLAVGDAAFQKKCLGKMGEVAETGRTVIFVSHNMGAVAGLCRRALWLNDGALCADGSVDDVMHSYLSTLNEGGFKFESEEHGLAITDVRLRNGRGENASRFLPGEDVTVEVSYEAGRPIEQPYFLLVVQGLQGTCFTANMLLDGQRPDRLSGTGRLLCRFREVPLLPQTYSIRMGVQTNDGRGTILNLQEVASFMVDGSVEEGGFRGELFHRHVARSTPVVVPYEWTLPDGSIRSVAIRLPSSRRLEAPVTRRTH